MAGCVSVKLCLALAALFVFVNSQGSPHRRFEYKMSFKGPHLTQRDGSIPFWEHGGHAIPSEDSIRITPSLRSKKGWTWSRVQNDAEHWEVEMAFRVSGRGKVGADGLALWYTEEKGQDGPVFGSSDEWKGLGVFFDSFDNDGQHNNPYIMAMVNDGTMKYDHESDGASQQIGGCLRDFRNKPYPVRVRVEYYKQALTVSFHQGMTDEHDRFELCLRKDGVQLPSKGYFGISGATGGLADDHDVQSFLTHRLSEPTPGADKEPPVSDEEKKKFEKEFDEHWEKLKAAKEDYQKTHPDKKPRPDAGYETQDERNLKLIFEAQNNIHNTINNLHRKLDEVIGRQERTMSQISMMGQGGTGAGGGGPPATGQIGADSIKRHEVDEVLRNQRDLMSSLKDMQNIVSTIQPRGGDGATGGYDAIKASRDLQDNLHTLQSDVKNIMNRQATVPDCPNMPPPPNCVSTGVFVVLLFMQAALIIGYSMYRSSKEAAAKKFY